MYKRTQHVLHRFFLAFTISAILFGIIHIASAVELYTPAKSWNTRTNSNQAYLKHYEYSLNNANKPSYVYPNASISSGYSKWAVNTSYGVRVYNQTIYTMNDPNLIVHMVPTESFWLSLFSTQFTALTTDGWTVNYDTNGTQITESNMSTTTSGIKSSNIFYRPPMSNEYVSLSTYTSTEFAALIAHEIGHALGFGHTTSSTSIMYPGTPANSLNQNDKTALYTKYPSA